MSELTDRLRKAYPAGAHHEYKDWGTCSLCEGVWPCDWVETYTDVHTASDEIERLEAKIQTLCDGLRQAAVELNAEHRPFFISDRPLGCVVCWPSVGSWPCTSKMVADDMETLAEDAA